MPPVIAALSPMPRLAFFDEAKPGAKLYTYLSETSTPATTYSTDQGTANANPIIADANGLFGPIFLPFGIAYRFTLNDSTDNLIYQQDHVIVGGAGGGSGGQTFNVVNYGATPGVSVNSGTQIQAAVDAAEAAASATSPATVFFPGMFRSSTQILSESSYVKFAGVGSYSGIQFDDVALNAGLRIAPPAASVIVTSLLTVNVAIGDRTITVADASSFAQGGWLYVTDDYTYNGSFITYIEGIAGNIITMQDAAPCVLLTAQNAIARYRPAGPLLGVEIRDMRVTCVSTTPTLLESLIRVFQCHGASVRNIQTSGSRVAGINLDQCTDGIVDDCLTENSISSSGKGVYFTNSTNCKITNTTARHTQFGLEVTKSPKSSIVACQVHARNTQTAGGRGIKIDASSNFSTITGNTVADPNFYGIYLIDSQRCVVSANTIYGCGDAVLTGQHGVQIGGFEDNFCVHNSIIANIITNCSGYGVAIAPTFDTSAKDIYALVQGNVITGCEDGAVWIFASNRNLVADNVILQSAAALFGTSAIYMSQSTPSKNAILHNTIFSVSGALLGIDTLLSDGTTIVLGNILGPSVTQTCAAGDKIFETIPTVIATAFETAARFGTTIAGAGANTFGLSGCACSAGGGGASAGIAGLTFDVASPANDNIFAGSPRFTVNLGLTTKGSDGQIYVGVSSLTSTATAITFTGVHFGFKITWAASGAASLFATQASGGVETASAALTTVAAGDALELIAQMNGSASVDYWWRKNGGALSAATTLTATVPTSGGQNDCQFSVNNTNIGSDSAIMLNGASYVR